MSDYDYPVRSTARVFQDVDGNDVSLPQLCSRDPEWARNRILSLEAEKADLVEALEQVMGKCEEELLTTFAINRLRDIHKIAEAALNAVGVDSV